MDSEMVLPSPNHCYEEYKVRTEDYKTRQTLPATSCSINFGPRPFAMLAATAATCAAIAAVFFAPWESLRIVGLTTITGIAYSMLHHRLGSRSSPEYYEFYSHFSDRVRSPFWQRTSSIFQVYANAGTVLAALSRVSISGLILKVTAVQLAPCFAIGVVLTLLISHFTSNRAGYDIPSGEIERLNSRRSMDASQRIGWYGSEVRDRTASWTMGLGGTVLAIGIIAARAGLIPL